MAGAGGTGTASEFRVVIRSSLWEVPTAIILAAPGSAWLWITGRQVVAIVILLTLAAVVYLRMARSLEIVADSDTVRKRSLLGWTMCQRHELKAIEASLSWAPARPVEDNPVMRYKFRLKDGRSAFELGMSNANSSAFKQLSRQMVELSKFLGIPIVDPVGGNHDPQHRAD